MRTHARVVVIGGGVTHASAKGARDRSAEIVRRRPVLETNPRRDGTWDVVTAQGTVVAERVVNAAGLWAREVAALAGIRLPLMATGERRRARIDDNPACRVRHRGTALPGGAGIDPQGERMRN